MNNLPLQPLVWETPLSGYIAFALSATNSYKIYADNTKYKLEYRLFGNAIREETGFATIDEAKAWAWRHYNEKMQPYVKPMPTWINVNERLPEQNTEVLVRYHAHFDDEEIKEFDVCTAFFYGSIFDVKDQHFYTHRIAKVTHWMPIPEFSTMQNNKGE